MSFILLWTTYTEHSAYQDSLTRLRLPMPVRLTPSKASKIQKASEAYSSANQTHPNPVRLKSQNLISVPTRLKRDSNAKLFRIIQKPVSIIPMSARLFWTNETHPSISTLQSK